MDFTELPGADRFRLITLRFTFASRSRVRFTREDLPGNLRDRFGNALVQLTCPFPNGLCDNHCVAPTPCLRDLLWRPGDNAVRPFIIQPPFPLRSEIAADEPLIFRITLLGYGVDHWPFIIKVVERMAALGFGDGQVPFRLDNVEQLTGEAAVFPSDQLASQQAPNEETTPVYVGPLKQNSPEIKIESLPDVVKRAERLSQRGVRIWFVTPYSATIKNWEEPETFVLNLSKAILYRWTNVLRACCDGADDVNFNAKDYATQISSNIQAAAVVGERSVQTKNNFQTKTNLPVTGFVGAFDIAGDLTQLLPLLVLAERIHIGKRVSISGFGQIYCETPPGW